MAEDEESWAVRRMKKVCYLESIRGERESAPNWRNFKLVYPNLA
jgi:hypothetical protein